ncbi:MAG: hypothetical protein IJV49_00095 [Aeriscardovia sp.]|nr:hypothetical protein [Aeriscardovia sp.]
MMAFMKSCASFMDVDSTGVFIHAASSGLSAFFHCPRTWLAETANEAPINMGKVLIVGVGHVVLRQDTASAFPCRVPRASGTFRLSADVPRRALPGWHVPLLRAMCAARRSFINIAVSGGLFYDLVSRLTRLRAGSFSSCLGSFSDAPDGFARIRDLGRYPAIRLDDFPMAVMPPLLWEAPRFF